MADEDVINQADALMRRHRSFVVQTSNAGEFNQQPVDEGDIPLLTEIVAAPEAQPSQNIDKVLDDLHREIEKTVSGWLVDALPAAITNASQHILAEIDAKARLTLLPQVQGLIDARRRNDQ